MANELVVEVDAEEVLDMLDALGPAATSIVHAASKVSSERIQQEARARVRRATGTLQEAITIEETEDGFRVFVGEMTDARGKRADEFALWHEAGTKHMSAQPFMGISAELEQGPHLRRLSDALQDAIDEVNS
jgi:hypothetical protein